MSDTGGEEEDGARNSPAGARGGGEPTGSRSLARMVCFVCAASHCYRLTVRRVEKALQHSYTGRKQKKRQYRGLWIQRINAGARQYDMTYGSLIHGMQDTGMQINRKIMAQLAIYEPLSFQALVQTVQVEADLPAKTYPTYGLLQSSVTSHVRPATRQAPVQLWSQQPSIADTYFKAQQRRLEGIAAAQQEQAEHDAAEAAAAEQA